jgi:hypothetical protein
MDTSTVIGSSQIGSFLDINSGFIRNGSNSIDKINFDGTYAWRTILPDTMTIDSGFYRPSTAIINYYPINYYGQFVVAAKYIDTSNSNFMERTFYFYVSDSTGYVERIPLPLFLSPPRYELYERSLITFFNTSANILSIISQEENKCLSDSSGLDLAIYHFGNLTPVKNNYSNEKSFSCFPNPAGSTLQLKLNDYPHQINAYYSIFDISGKPVGKDKLEGSETTIDISALPNGLYLLNLVTANSSETKKFMVIH